MFNWCPALMISNTVINVWCMLTTRLGNHGKGILMTCATRDCSICFRRATSTLNSCWLKWSNNRMRYAMFEHHTRDSNYLCRYCDGQCYIFKTAPISPPICNCWCIHSGVHHHVQWVGKTPSCWLQYSYTERRLVVLPVFIIIISLRVCCVIVWTNNLFYLKKFTFTLSSDIGSL